MRLALLALLAARPAALVLRAGRAPAAVAGGACSDDTTLTVYAAASLTVDLRARSASEFEDEPRRASPSSSASPAPPTWSPRSRRALRPTCSPRPTRPTWTSSPPTASRAPTPSDFATNTLEIADPPDNPAGVESLRRTWPARPQPGHLRTRGPVRRRRPDGRRVRRRRPRPGQRGAVRDRRARQGHLRRGRRRAGLRHRRDRRRRRRRGHRVPRVRRGRSTSTRSPPSPTATTPTWPRSSSTWSSATTGQSVLADAGFAPALSVARDGRTREPGRRCPRWLYVPAAASARASCCCRWSRSWPRVDWANFFGADHLGVLARRRCG